MNCDLELARYSVISDLREYYISMCKGYFGWNNAPKNSFGRWLIELLPYNTLDYMIPNNDIPENPLHKEISEDFPNKIYPILHFIKDKKQLNIFLTKYKEETKKIITVTSQWINNNSLSSIVTKIARINLDKMSFTKGHQVVTSLTKELNTEMRKLYKPLVDLLIKELINKSREYAENISSQINIPGNYLMNIEEIGDNISINYKSEIDEYNSNNLTTITMPRNIYDMLYEKYRRTSTNVEYNDILRDIWIMYRRYETFINIDSQSSSLQAAVPYSLMNYLNTALDVNFECFASPINSYLPNYCSAFKDTDENFGSSGSFFNYDSTIGSYEVNPPFAENIMNLTVDHITNMLSKSNDPLSFIIILPRWDDTHSIITLRKSPFLVTEIIVNAKQHSYRQSDQQKQFLAIHDTLIFILQNTEGFQKWPIDQQIVNNIIMSFKS